MKVLHRTLKQLDDAIRWDIDFHLPPTLINDFRKSIITEVKNVAEITRISRDPTANPDTSFRYIDISAVSVQFGVIGTVQELTGDEAPSRARKVVRAFDLLVSTVRPTRRSVAIVPPQLDNEIASTGFSVLSPKLDTNPIFLHFALRLSSTSEQFRKWSTGSSYPAILESDVEKTRIPMPKVEIQDEIARLLIEAANNRVMSVREIEAKWAAEMTKVQSRLLSPGAPDAQIPEETLLSFENWISDLSTTNEIHSFRKMLATESD